MQPPIGKGLQLCLHGMEAEKREEGEEKERGDGKEEVGDERWAGPGREGGGRARGGGRKENRGGWMTETDRKPCVAKLITVEPPRTLAASNACADL